MDVTPEPTPPERRDRLGLSSAEPAPAARSPRPRRRQSRLLGAVRALFGLVSVVIVIGGLGAGLVAWNLYQRYAGDLPTLDGLRTWQPPVMSRVYAGDDRLMEELASERRIFVPFTAIPERVKQAFIAAEDQSFYTHKGLDPFAIARAAYTDLQHIGGGKRPIGASTITQQVARNMLLGSNAVSFERKAREALLALRIEKVLTKERILELYLNEIYLGQGAYGVAAASQTFFNKPLDQLTVAEAATLAALPKSPSNYNPFRYPDAARGRRDWVIDRMVETHAITTEAAAAAHAEPLLPNEYRKPQSLAGAGWFAEEVRRRLIERFGQDQTTEGGLIVHTSFDERLQTAADDALRHGLMAYDHAHGGWHGVVGHVANTVSLRGDWQDALGKLPRAPGLLPGWQMAVVLSETSSKAVLGWVPSDGSAPLGRTAALPLAGLWWARHVAADGTVGAAPRRMADIATPGDVVMIEPDGQGRPQLRQVPRVSGALVSLDPRSGRVLALSGGWSADHSQFDRATQAQRQPGSSFKPFVYLTALEQGVSPRDKFDDGPFSLGDWHPNNYEMTYGGPTPLHIALEQSLNLVTVRVAQKVGMSAVARTATAFHMVDSMPKVLPAALGAVETTVMREAGAYASIAEGGREVVPSLIDSVQDRDGHVIWRPPGLVLGAGGEAGPTFEDARPQLADAASTYQLLMMMEGVVKNGTGKPAVIGIDRPVAGKTGTSQDYNDAWFAGATPDLVTVVWIGFDQPQTLGDKQTGGEVAGPIWRQFTRDALGDVPAHEFAMPAGVELWRWSCGVHDCIDAFKPEQAPGAAVASDVSDDDGPATSDVRMLDAETGQKAADATPRPPPSGPGTGVDSGQGALY